MLHNHLKIAGGGNLEEPEDDKIDYSATECTVDFDANGGIMETTIVSPTYYYGQAMGNLPSATRTGYTFNGWWTSASGGTQYTVDTVLYTTSITLYAHWTKMATTYTVSYNANGGSGAPSSSTYIEGNTYILSSTTPTRTGYTFSGWSLGSAGGTLYQAGATIPIKITLAGGDHTWYANWTINTYTMKITYYKQCATNSTSIYISSSLGSGSISSGSVKTLSSTYTTTTYTITVSRNNSSYDYYFGLHTTPTTSSSVNSLSFTWKPTYNDYWYIYVYQKYVIIYDGNGATGGTVPSSQNKIYGTSVTLSANNLTKEGYKADGWNTSTTYTETPEYCQDDVLSLYSENASVTLYANFLEQRSDMTFNLMTISKTGEVSNSAVGGYGGITGYSMMIADGPHRVEDMWYSDKTKTSFEHAYQTDMELTFIPHESEGYIFLGISSSSSPPVLSDSSAVVNTWTPTQKEETLYAFFKECSHNLLKYDSIYEYYYFEDGYMPQTYAEMIESGLNAKITNNGTLLGAYTLENGTSYKLAGYDDNIYLGIVASKDMTLDLETYSTIADSSVSPAKAGEIINGYEDLIWMGTYSFTKGTLYWFRFEPIRWRITDFGTTTPPEEWSYGQYHENYTVVSDLVLWYDCMATENYIEGKNAFDMTFTSSLRDGNFETMLSTFTNNFTDGEFLYSGSNSAEWQKFGEANQQNPVQIDSTHTTSDYELTNINKYTSGSTSSLRVASTDEIYNTIGNTKARASCLVAFMTGLSNYSIDKGMQKTVCYSKYWTRDLGNNLNAGKVVAKNGLTRSEWLSNSNGIRFAYTMSEGSRGTL